jgi:hypothetical protein
LRNVHTGADLVERQTETIFNKRHGEQKEKERRIGVRERDKREDILGFRREGAPHPDFSRNRRVAFICTATFTVIFVTKLNLKETKLYLPSDLCLSAKLVTIFPDMGCQLSA